MSLSVHGLSASLVFFLYNGFTAEFFHVESVSLKVHDVASFGLGNFGILAGFGLVEGTSVLFVRISNGILVDYFLNNIMISLNNVKMWGW